MKIKNKLILTFLFISFLNIRASHFSLDNEIKTIQTLPRKPQGATLDIEVTKVKTEKINGFFDEKNKKVVVDFSQKINQKTKDLKIDKNEFDIFIFDNPNDISFFSSTGRKDKRSALTLPKLYNYKIDENNKNLLKIDYEKKPENLYLGFRNKNTKFINVYDVTWEDENNNRRIRLESSLVINNPVILATDSMNITYPFKSNLGNNKVQPEILNTSGIPRRNLYPYLYSATRRTQGSDVVGKYGLVNNEVWNHRKVVIKNYFRALDEYSDTKQIERTNLSNYTMLRYLRGNKEATITGQKLSPDPKSLMNEFLMEAERDSIKYLTMGFQNWNLQQQKIVFKYGSDNEGTNDKRGDEYIYIHIPPFDPEAYYDNANSTIKLDNKDSHIDTSEFWTSDSLNPTYTHSHNGANLEIDGIVDKKVNLGTIKILDEALVPQIASDIVDPSNPLKFYTAENSGSITLVDTNNSNNTITGRIYVEDSSGNKITNITAENSRTAKNVYLELDELKKGTFIVDKRNKNIVDKRNKKFVLGLGVPSKNIHDDIISDIKLNIARNSALIINYDAENLDFGTVIQGQFNANEAKTKINIIYNEDLDNPSFKYELQEYNGSKANFYNNFKLYKDGDRNSENYAEADLWLGIESIPNSNEPNNRTIDLNGRLKNIEKAPAGDYTNTINIVVTREEAP